MWLRRRSRNDRVARRVVVSWNHVDAKDAGSDRHANARRWILTGVTQCAPRAGPVFFPLDDELGLLPGELSSTLAQGVARLGAKMPFEQAKADLAFFWKVELDETTVRRYTQAVGAAYVAEQAADLERLERERPPAPVGPAVQYLSADGAMVPLVGGEWAEVKTLAIGAVQVRSGADGLPEAHTTDLSYFSRLTDAETFTRQAYVETYRRGTETANVVCAVQDGAEWEQGLVNVLRADAVRILDFPHAVEHLTTAAEPVFGKATPELRAWLDAQAHTLKHATDGARQVLTVLAKLPVQRAVDPAAAADARERTVTYFTKRLAQVQYAAFQAAGYPIGSGSTESANKVVVEARLKGSGMHWARAHVDPLVALRTIACADRWHEAWPRITARLRTVADQRRRARRRLRHPGPPEVAPPTGHIDGSAQVAAAAHQAMPRGKSIVNGRPTPLHPWKRYGFNPLRRQCDLRFPN